MKNKTILVKENKFELLIKVITIIAIVLGTIGIILLLLQVLGIA